MAKRTPVKQSTKSKDFLKRLQDAKANGVTLIVIQAPQELGDNYQEMVETLNQLAAMDMNLAILPKEARRK